MSHLTHRIRRRRLLGLDPPLNSSFGRNSGDGRFLHTLGGASEPAEFPAARVEEGNACDQPLPACAAAPRQPQAPVTKGRSEEHTSELQSLMRSSYAVFCLKKKK